MDKIPFAPPRIDQAIIDEVTAALQSGWITTGPRTKQLEKEIAARTQSPAVLCLGSATAGMELVLRWLGVGPGDEVIVPAYTYCATANVVVHCGAKPVMVDVLHTDGTIDPEKVAAAITPRTKAIMPVDLGGMPANYRELRDLFQLPAVQSQFQARTPEQEKLGRIALIVDAAHSIGASYRRQPAATYGDATVFSFHAVKNLTTAEGGAVCLNFPPPFDNSEIYKTLNRQSLHGQSKDALAKFGGNAWEYDVLEAGYKCNMPDILAAIGLVEIKRYEEDTLPVRKAQFARYHLLLQDYPWAELPYYATAEKQSSCHLYLLRIRDITLEQRNAIIEKVMEAGVSVNVHYKPLPLLSVYRDMGYTANDYPVSLDFYHREISLPVFYDLTPNQQERVVKVLATAVKEVVSQEV
ncbi:MAG: DegT/DnrJ/EryC1/StrS aminotransferase family protein [Saprospirales bacterium]|nr:DegT/DnrJ/EryC1/StrS aminotransferase family protein [Saprospirales bacterium]